VSGGRLRNIFVYLIILVAAAFFFFNLSSQSKKVEEIPISDIVAEIKAGRVEQIIISGDYSTLSVEFKDRREPMLSRMGVDVDVVEGLRNLGVTEEELAAITIDYQQPSSWAGWITLLSGILPAILFVGLFYFLLRQAQGSNNQALSFGKSRARMFTGDQPTVTFEDVAGVEEAKEELYEVVEFLKEPEKFIALGARIPKGVLLVGAPGTGKTLMAKAVSGEAGVPFFSISGSEFVEMFVGVGASRVRDLFDQAKRHSPCIIFVDEIDAVGRQRGAGLGGSHDEREQTLNQILVEMDGFDTDTNVIILAASNRPDILDPALLRPGRFDRRVVLDIPDILGRKGILEVHVKGKPLANDIDLEILARRTPGFVGADIESMVNEAAILAARASKKVIGMEEFEEAIERVLAGPERKSRIISDDEKEIIAYHEAGHAMVMGNLPLCDPVHKVSIVSRGMALGYTMPLPEEDRYLRHRAKFKDQLAGLLGGRAAEELMFNDVTTGAANDLMQATRLARKMVCEFGMSENLGPMTFGKKQELVFLGREISERRDYGEAVAQEIDQEVRRFINEAHSRAREILTTYRDKLIALAQRLIEDETLEGPELEAMLA